MPGRKKLTLSSQNSNQNGEQLKIRMRIIQRFDTTKEKEFLKFEKLFADLETSRPDYPKGKRLLPISASEPCNTLIWECDFPDIETAYETLDFF